ncbi:MULTISPECIES: ankyrin repeat domain-containing protein [Chryseobacterium]|uniref:Ankyrin repeat protein n=1 Tax=Chryseobacterium camelliae TaxID=1265445 RepID=A0ABU0TJF3_9FLAO|nr:MULTISPECIES: ankyrin repeat domain-containing protein [Chryseobacterium]MDQ1097184.1 ankyrin repeat protein [Chryseobacterium camelliae]MDQ1101121.1 ankyrin repeat protein [Chryseobacterium sp. SORGH_AS_1048]MDR6132833.1 ankyrin repeat protein [Chryseobacterium sp. SORGH_AS_1175]MDT3408959.1 ankyrin repeat protein [Pseudacidovorax intermedius]
MRKIIILFSLLLMVEACNKIDQDKKVDKNNLLGADYRLFQDTPAWNLAKAVWGDDVDRIDEEVKKNPQIINYQEKKYGNTLLNLSIYNDNYKGFKELLKLGANPNIADLMHCSSPLITACESFDDKTKYVEELIRYKAEVNFIECDEGKQEQKTNRTPLICASFTGNLRTVKTLIRNGAKINFTNNKQAGSALGIATLSRNYDIVLYLLQQGADCRMVLYKKYGNDNSEISIYMKEWINDEADHSVKEYSEIKKLLKKKGCL